MCYLKQIYQASYKTYQMIKYYFVMLALPKLYNKKYERVLLDRIYQID